VSNVGRDKRSFETIDLVDLRRLAQLSSGCVDAFFVRHPRWAGEYRDRLLALTLCQGAADHYLGRGCGIQDFDVWAFFRADSRQLADRRLFFPPRWRGTVDYGPSKFGRNPDEVKFAGRRVDVMGRSIPVGPAEKPEDSIRGYLSSGQAASPRLLRKRPAIWLQPDGALGRVIWDPEVDLKDEPKRGRGRRHPGPPGSGRKHAVSV